MTLLVCLMPPMQQTRSCCKPNLLLSRIHDAERIVVPTAVEGMTVVLTDDVHNMTEALPAATQVVGWTATANSTEVPLKNMVHVAPVGLLVAGALAAEGRLPGTRQSIRGEAGGG